MEVRKGNGLDVQGDAGVLSSTEPRESSVTFDLPPSGPDQAFQSDTEQSRQEEATRRTRELLHLVHRSRGCWRRRARGGHQGRHLAEPSAVLLGTFRLGCFSLSQRLWGL